MSIYIEMNLFFDNDFDVYKIEKLLNIEPSDCKRRNETRLSPFDKSKHLDGYWSLMTDTFEELDIKPAMDDLLKKLEGKLEIIKEICKKNNGEVNFEIVSIFEKDNLPAIYFEKRFLNIVNYLDAVIDIDMYLN
mgnify:FL=1|nr:DUF4279 domain-containing protein [uncultured Anaerobutyricum sp.]